MNDLFILTFLLSVLAFGIGMVKPSIFQFVRGDALTRKSLAKVLLPTIFVSFLGVGLTANPIEQRRSANVVQEAPEAASDTPAETRAAEAVADPEQTTRAAQEPSETSPRPSTSSSANEPARETEVNSNTNEAAEPTSEPEPTARTSPTTTCRCDADIYNCARDFATQAQAQAVYDCCMAQVGHDVHGLDGDNDGKACESLPH